MRPAATLCRARGYCGPFLSQQRYESSLEPLGHGMGECALCRTVVRVAEEEHKRLAVLARLTRPR